MAKRHTLVNTYFDTVYYTESNESKRPAEKGTRNFLQGVTESKEQIHLLSHSCDFVQAKWADLHTKFFVRPTEPGALYVKVHHRHELMTTSGTVQTRQNGIQELQQSLRDYERKHANNQSLGQTAQIYKFRDQIANGRRQVGPQLKKVIHAESDFSYTLSCTEANRVRKGYYEIWRVGENPANDTVVPCPIVDQLPFTDRQHLGINLNIRILVRIENDPSYRASKAAVEQNSTFLSVPSAYLTEHTVSSAGPLAAPISQVDPMAPPEKTA